MLSRLLLHISCVQCAFRVEIVLFAHHCNRMLMKYLGAMFPTEVCRIVFLFSCGECQNS